MRIKNIIKRKPRSSGWYKPTIQPDRELDLIDDTVLLMARCIRVMREGGVRFSGESYSALISDYSKCARLNWSLTPAQRLTAIGAISDKNLKESLIVILRNAAK